MVSDSEYHLLVYTNILNYPHYKLLAIRRKKVIRWRWPSEKGGHTRGPMEGGSTGNGRLKGGTTGRLFEIPRG
jgi:hypothetical protein